MKITWLTDYDDIGAEIQKQNHTWVPISSYLALQNKDYVDSNGFKNTTPDIEPNECVLFQGTIQSALWLLKNKSWIPTAWLTIDNYKCSHYYPQLAQFLFNEKYVLLPRGDVTRNLHWLSSILGVDGCLFIRPDSGLKTFGGNVFEIERFEKDWCWAEEFCPPYESVLISNPKNIQEEFRFICKQGEIVSGSKYKSRYALDISTAISKSAKIKCQEILDTGFAPDPMFVLDICKGMNDDYYLLEVNAFSTCGLYDCDLSKIVKAASELAWHQHQEIFN